MFDERVERLALARLSARADLAALRDVLLDPARRSTSTSTAAPTPPSSSRCTSTRRRPARRLHPPAATTCAATRARSPSPAGAQDPDEPTCRPTALREAEEEIGLPPDAVELARRAAADADDRDQLRDLPLRRAHRAGPEWSSRPREVDGVLELSLGRRCARATAGSGCVRRGIPFRTDVYVVGERSSGAPPPGSLGDLLERLGRPAALAPASPSRSGRRRGCPTRSTSRRSS